MENDIRQICDLEAKRIFTALREKLQGTAECHSETILSLLEFQLVGPFRFDETERRRQIKMLTTAPAIVTPIIQEIMDELEQAAQSHAEKDDNRFRAELRCSLVLEIARYRVTELERQVAARFGRALILLMVMIAPGLAYTVWRIIRHFHPQA